MSRVQRKALPVLIGLATIGAAQAQPAEQQATVGVGYRPAISESVQLMGIGLGLILLGRKLS